ncbi:MAG: cytochrome C [Desulfuromonadales bacterium]|nr:cytochrome C [Desulfuromonadales bacterium]
MSKRVWIALLAGLTLLSVQTMAGAAGPAAAPAPNPPVAASAPKLLTADCAKCHSKAPADIAAAGSKHKTEISCQDCHNGHPPTTRKIIPLCSQCHEGKPHYKLDACQGCHSNPHTPLKITFGNKVTDACITCHATGQIDKLRDNKSKHSALYCSTCHDVHGKIPNCTQCHKAHFAEQTTADCKKCHQAHMPKNVTYSDKLPSKDCAACHKKAYDQLTASTFKHKTLTCVACHQAKHKMIPQCQSCHGTPHPAAMLSKFPKCGFCHSIAHDLNGFKDGAAPASAASPAAAVTTTAPVKKQPKKK